MLFQNIFLLLPGLLFLNNFVDSYSFYGLDFEDAPIITNLEDIDTNEKYTKLQIQNLKGTLNVDTFFHLGNITALKIFENNISEIKPGAVCFVPSLKSIELNFNGNENPPFFDKNVFKNCENLEELALIFYNETVPKLAEDTFENMPNLRFLTINFHKIPHLKKKMFNNLISLTELVLLGDSIEQIDFDVFENLNKLKVLGILHHELQHLPNGLFKNTPNLIKLFLSNGHLTDLTWDEFEGLASLKELFLASNFIKYFDAEKIVENMPNLETVSVELNPVECKQMEVFANELKQKFTHPIHVTFKYDPGFFDSCEEPF